MNRRKLQVFISSTYEDLIDERLAAIEAILAAGHIPAAMEQFSPGDETAWETIRAWIDESDAFILILGGRYGSIEPDSGKSYVQLEYEYAIEKKKPFFALVIHDEAHAVRVREHRLGIRVDEREKQAEYKQFRGLVTERLCRFWRDRKDIQAAIFQKLPDWSRLQQLVGWIRADHAPSAATTDELARLSQENRELRGQIGARVDDFHGLSFDEMAALLRQEHLDQLVMHHTGLLIPSDMGVRPPDAAANLGVAFDALFADTNATVVSVGKNDPAFTALGMLASNGLLNLTSSGDGLRQFHLSDVELKFRNRLRIFGDWKERLRELWKVDSQA